MTSFDEFCLHYDLNADAPDLLLKFEQYRDAYERLMSVIGKIPQI
jgi:hypothetical protein